MPTAVRVETAPTYFILPNKAENGGTRMGDMKNARNARKASMAGKVGKACKVSRTDGANGAAIKVKVHFGQQTAVSGVTAAQNKMDAAPMKASENLKDQNGHQIQTIQQHQQATVKANSGKQKENAPLHRTLTPYNVKTWREFIPTLKEKVGEFSAIRGDIVWKVLHHEMFAHYFWSNLPSCQNRDWYDLVDYISEVTHIAKAIVAAVLINEELVADDMWNQRGQLKQCEKEALEIMLCHRLSHSDDEDVESEDEPGSDVTDPASYSTDTAADEADDDDGEGDDEDIGCHCQSKVVSAEVELSDMELVMEIADRTGICPKAVEEVIDTMHSIFAEIARDVREDINEINASGGLCCGGDGSCDNDDPCGQYGCCGNNDFDDEEE